MRIPLARIGARIHQSYFTWDRLAEYRSILGEVRDRGYRFVTAFEHASAVRTGNGGEAPTCILRVDVDTDPAGAGRMFEVERELRIRSTYYFRFSTIDRDLIMRMTGHGSEVGYHFEELSTLARRRGFRKGFDLDSVHEELREKFRQNVGRFRRETGVAPRTVVAHGDFLNRRLGIDNHAFVDRPLLEELGIVAEMYQPELWRRGSARVADRPAPVWWRSDTPQTALEKRPDILWLILHPRQWVGSAAANLRADVSRIVAEAEYRWNCLRRAGR